MSLREHNSKPFPRSVIERYQLRDIHFDKHPFQIDTSDRPTDRSFVRVRWAMQNNECCH